MTSQMQAILTRFALGLVIVELPIVTAALARPDFDWRLLSIGLLGGLAAAVEKLVAPQLTTEGVAEIPPVLPVKSA